MDSISLLSTPKKKNKRYSSKSRSSDSQDALVESPYFSPSNTRRPKFSGLSDIDTFSSDIFRRLEDLSKDTTASTVAELTQNTRMSQHAWSSSSDDTPATLSELILRLEGLKPILIQECVADDPWKLLVAVTLLNKTTGRLAVPAFWNIVEKWPTPLKLSQADEHELVSVIHHLGTQNIRAKRLIALSRSYMQDPPSVYDVRPSSTTSRSSRFFTTSSIVVSQYPATPISHLPGTGPYALDSYRIFSSSHDDPGSEEWKRVLPADKELIRFLKWKWAFTEGMEWSPTKGVIGNFTEKYVSALILELERNIVP